MYRESESTTDERKLRERLELMKPEDREEWLLQQVVIERDANRDLERQLSRERERTHYLEIKLGREPGKPFEV